jgi:speckle-type POZ protein
LSDDFGRLLLAGEETDVAFRIRGESFAAHRNVLAARSPVFRAQLFGQVGANNRNFITIEDVEPGIFKALLHFIYTDSFPDIGDIDLDEIH